MTGEIFEITFFMWVVAIFAFAPFAYFIYMYVVKSNEYGPFVDNPARSQQPGLEDKVLGMAEQLLSKLKGVKK